MKVNDEFEKLFGDAKVINDDIEVYRPLLARWLLELAMTLEWYKIGSSRKSREIPSVLTDDDFCVLTGMGAPDDEDNDISPPKTSAGWKRYFKASLDKARKVKLDTKLPLYQNIALLTEMLKLNGADRVLLLFAASMTLFPKFRGAIMPRNVSTTHQMLHRILSKLSGLTEVDFQAATSSESVLVASGLVRIANGVKDLEDKLELLKGVANAMLAPHSTAEELTRRFIRKAAAPTLGIANFDHLKSDNSILLPFLDNSVSTKTTGVNVLLYGKPGFGKSEYAQVLASELGIELYEIAFADSDGDPMKGSSRLQAFAFCQNLLSRSKRALLLFDEIEDVFPEGSGLARLFGGEDTGETAGKAWINRTMENNPVPALWISNRVSQIDPAFLRRFDYSVQFQTPPIHVRLNIARHHLAEFNPPETWLDRIAAAEDLAPAQIERAAKVARLAKGDNCLTLIEQVLERSCSLLHTRSIPKRIPSRTGYDLRFLNTDLSIDDLIGGLKHRPSASLCFYGPAGTGKSELGRHISDQLGKPLVIKRASDILSMYVGESEKNIAEMFREARNQGAVLVLDEADSFLSDRRNAQRSWEVTQVNELLTQMEAFDGVFICTTNLMDKLDPASLRRFSFKVKFNYLTADQRAALFLQLLERLGGDTAAADSYYQHIRRLEQLTPGDFAVAARQFELWGTSATAQKLYEQLAKECEAKGVPARKIGFGV